MAPLRRTHGYVLAVAIAAVSFASILVRYAQAESVPPLVTSFYRLLFATLMLLPFWLARARDELASWSWRESAASAGVGFLLAAHFATWVTSLEYTSVASSVVIVATESLWVPLGTAFLLRERVTHRFWAGLAVALAGMVVLVSGDRSEVRFSPEPLVGDALALAGALAASLYFLAGRRLRQGRSLVGYATVVYAWSTLFLGLMVLVRGDELAGYSGRAYGVLFLFALFPMILGHTLMNFLLRWVPPHYISTAILGEPVVSTALAWVLLHEPPRALVALGGALMLAGIIVALRFGNRSVAEGAHPPGEGVGP